MSTADRFIAAQAWWIASEVARRSPHLRIAETDHAEVGSSLSVYDPADPMICQVLLNSAAGINVVGDPFSRIDWNEVNEATSPHEIVRRLEAALVLEPQAPAPPTNERTIIYRAIATTLGMLVNDRHSWIIRGERPEDPSVLDSIDWTGDFSALPSAVGLMERWRMEESNVLADQGMSHIWALWKDLQLVALFDMYGGVHTELGRDDLMGLYRGHHRSMISTVAAALGRVLR